MVQTKAAPCPCTTPLVASGEITIQFETRQGLVLLWGQGAGGLPLNDALPPHTQLCQANPSSPE